MRNIQLYMFLLILALAIQHAKSQDEIFPRSIIVAYGGNLPFVFNTFSHYNSGFTYEDWTRINVHYNDTITVGTPSIGWEISIKAQSDEFISDSGYDGLPLPTLRLRVENNTVPAPSVPPHSIDIEVPLSDMEQIIASSDKISNVNGYILISYDFGKPPNHLLGVLPDYYSVNLIFKLKPVY